MEGWKEKSVPRESSVLASFTLFQMGPTGFTHIHGCLQGSNSIQPTPSVQAVKEKLIPEGKECMDQMSENLVKYQFACSLFSF